MQVAWWRIRASAKAGYKKCQNNKINAHYSLTYYSCSARPVAHIVIASIKQTATYMHANTQRVQGKAATRITKCTQPHMQTSTYIYVYMSMCMCSRMYASVRALKPKRIIATTKAAVSALHTKDASKCGRKRCCERCRRSPPLPLPPFCCHFFHATHFCQYLLEFIQTATGSTSATPLYVQLALHSFAWRGMA